MDKKEYRKRRRANLWAKRYKVSVATGFRSVEAIESICKLIGPLKTRQRLKVFRILEILYDQKYLP